MDYCVKDGQNSDVSKPDILVCGQGQEKHLKCTKIQGDYHQRKNDLTEAFQKPWDLELGTDFSGHNRQG